MRMVVVFPPPFGPRNPTTSPLEALKESPSMALRGPYHFVRSVTSIIPASMRGEFAGRFGQRARPDHKFVQPKRGVSSEALRFSCILHVFVPFPASDRPFQP